MRRSGFIKRKTPLNKKGKSEVSKIKVQLQAILRELAILRDGGCVLEDIGAGKCGPLKNDGTVILQFDHLLSRERAIAWNIDLGVCVCMRHHIYYKKKYPTDYEQLVREKIGKERCRLLDLARAYRGTVRMTADDWAKIAIAYNSDLKKIKNGDKLPILEEINKV